MNFTLHIWRQEDASSTGRMVTYDAKDVSPDMSFLEMLDVLNENLIVQNDEPIAFDHDCREGICGTCSLMINGIAHGPQRGTTTCQLYMRHFEDGDTFWIEPWRNKAFPVIQDLMVDRTAFDRIVQSGGFISARTGSAPEANGILVSKFDADSAMDAAVCIGCGACVAACPNGSAALFTGSKLTHLALLPQGQPERSRRAIRMVTAMDLLGFGNCTMHRECEAVCPAEIRVNVIVQMNGEFLRASFLGREIITPSVSHPEVKALLESNDTTT